DYASQDFFDVWYPALAPSAELLRWFRRQPDFEKAWLEYAHRYPREMATRPDARQAVQLVAALAQRTPIAIGCYCADETRCHRSLLAKIIREAAAGDRSSPIPPLLSVFGILRILPAVIQPVKSQAIRRVAMPNLFRKSESRKAWRRLKTAHEKAIKAKKIQFKQDLGKALDKEETLEMKDWKTEEQKLKNIKAIHEQGKVVIKIAEDYLVRIKGMGDPAEKALRENLERTINNSKFYDFMKW
ncbi:MAG: DUF488 domain-containing protein, partial [Anaerolineales bacterium]